MSKCTYNFHTNDNILYTLKFAFFTLRLGTNSVSIIGFTHFSSAAEYSIEWMHHNLFDQLHIDGHLSCFSSFAITDNTVVTCTVCKSFCTYVRNP